MEIRNLSINEFQDFVKNSKYGNFRQTLDYALLKSEHGYEYEIIGYCNGDDIHAAALVLVKLLDGYLYAYIPSGFIADYDNTRLIQDFTEDLYNYYKKEDIVFIKINPPIPIAEIDNKNFTKKYNNNNHITSILKECGYEKIKDSNDFKTMLPNINAMVDLDNFDEDKLNKNTKNKIRKAIRKGLTLEIGNMSNIDYLNEFVKKKINRSEFYYNDYYSIFKKSNAIDYFLVSIDYEKLIINSQEAYNSETRRNNKLYEKIITRPKNKNINVKMNSDKALESYKNDIVLATQKINNTEKEYIAGALVVRFENTATIIISGYDKKYGIYSPNYFLYNEICKYYKNEVKFLDLNGLTADFSKNNKYHGLNNFKLGFKPNIYEYIGEYDLVINKKAYNHLDKKGLLQKEIEKNK